MKNIIGREVPEYIEGIGKIDMFVGAWEKLKKGWMDEVTISPPNKAKLPHQSKMHLTLEEAILKTSNSSKNLVLKVTVYISDIALWDRVNSVYARFFGDHRPARAVVPTRELHFGYQIEVEAIAAAEKD